MIYFVKFFFKNQIIPGGWIRDYKPGPYPKTPEEREAAARKYNLIPEDYDCYEEGSGYGDYPKLPVVSQDAMDPYEEYDNYYRRRNFGQTVCSILTNFWIFIIMNLFVILYLYL